MPFKNFLEEEGEARSRSVSFGHPLQDALNGDAFSTSRKTMEFDVNKGDVLPLHPAIPTNNSLHKPRNKSPSRGTAQRETSPYPVLPGTNGISSGGKIPPMPNARDQAFHREDFPTNRLSQRPLNAVDNNFGKSSSRLRTQEGRHKPGRSNDRPAAETHVSSEIVDPKSKHSSAPGQRSRLFASAIHQFRPVAAAETHVSSEIVEPKSKHSSAPEQPSRLLASAIHQFRPVEDRGNISLSGEQLRDELAKGRRLRRFNDPPAKSSPLVYAHTDNQNTASDQLVDARTKEGTKFLGRETRENTPDLMTDVEVQDGGVERDWQSTEPILGICPDMCPESEREERERKGDLDKLERVDGDRNQTRKHLAVKKYTRTAEKHPSLIRPIPVLLKTMEHLLHLLERGYDDELLNLHNFLWDRMRAVRMDLRMQHIFNQQAVVMHEQMIRFHILAMHELCEYAKGEGFTEGFDSHLNIEQMNKASVDLFHMYDDLRKAGNRCASEAEFRGYYALLKLDKHPGYVVEPAELSLDLAKMTPEMRNTPEVQFARKVARACRLGNFLAFFRLASDATYLQACLMHAHFSKLRSQGMASLYGGLQKNQGIPLLQVSDWLGMEGENIEALVEYHGFSVKNYEEPYIVKDGPLLNQGQDFPTRRSRLVGEKRSQKIREDVLSTGRAKGSVLERIPSLRRQSDVVSPREVAIVVDEEMPDYEEEEQPLPIFLTGHHGVFAWHSRNEVPPPNRASEMEVPATPQLIIGHTHISPSKGQDDSEWLGTISKRRKSPSSFAQDTEFGCAPDEHLVISKDKKKLRTISTEGVVLAGPRAVDLVDVWAPAVQTESYHHDRAQRQEASRTEADLKRVELLLKAEADLGKVRLLLRKWRARAAIKAEERHWQQQKLEAALNSFHVGLPLQHDEKGLAREDGLAGHLDFGQAESARCDTIERMWRGLDVIKVVCPVIKQKNSSCKYLCWKLLLCSGLQDGIRIAKDRADKSKSGEWLVAKLLKGNDKGLSSMVMSSNSAYVASRYEAEMPFFYIARDIQLSNREMEVCGVTGGASGVIFLVSETASMNEERGRLHTLVEMLHDGAKLPLLVLYSERVELINLGARGSCTTSKGNATALAELLDMDSLDQSKIASWSALSIIGSRQAMAGSPHRAGDGRYDTESRGFYSEELLKEGLSWLASKAPTQPNLRSVHVQSLVGEHLHVPFQALLAIEPTAASPESCAKAFNEALLKTANDIITSAMSSPPHWPPDELREAFMKLTPDMTWLLPSPDWNKTVYFHPIVEALAFSQLPEFHGNLPSLMMGTASLMEQKAVIEHMLHEYMNGISGSARADLLIFQAVNAVLQKACVFKRMATGCLLIIPNWGLIFQQFYQVRLALLSSEPPPIVWVQARPGSHEETDMMIYPDLSQYPGPTLDEMIQLEAQEVLLQKKKEAQEILVQRNKDVKMLMDGGDGGKLPAWMVAGMKVSKVARHDDGAEEVQDGVMLRGASGFEAAIAPATEAEMELESMVEEFCRRVDQGVAEAIEMESSHMQQHEGGHSTVAANAQEYLYTGSDWLTHLYIHDDASPRERDEASPGSHPWPNTDSTDSLAQLLQHCENVQHTIDKTLRECFRMGGATSWQ